MEPIPTTKISICVSDTQQFCYRAHTHTLIYPKGNKDTRRNTICEGTIEERTRHETTNRCHPTIVPIPPKENHTRGRGLEGIQDETAGIGP